MARDDPRELLSTFGMVIREERRRLGISQEELADRAGLHRTYLGGIELGKRNAALLNLDRIARALDISLGQLFAAVDAARHPPKA